MTIPMDDRGLTLGDGLFETVLAVGRDLVLWNEHVARLQRGSVALGLPTPAPDELLTAARTALEEAGLKDARAAVRLTWTAGSGGRGLDRPAPMTGRLYAVAAPAPESDQMARLAMATIRRNPASPTSRFKTLSYVDNVLARAEARAAGADEALLLNTSGELACAAAANLFWAEGEALYTPRLDCGVLDGVVRDMIVGQAGVAEVRAWPACLERATAVYLTNSLIGVREAVSLDARPLSRDGVMLARLRAIVAGAPRC